MPVNAERSVRILTAPGEVDLGQFSRENRLAPYRQFFLKNPKLFKSFGQFKSNCILIRLVLQIDFDLKPHGYRSASIGKVFWLDEVSNPVRAACQFLQNFQRKTDRRFSRSIFSNHQERWLSGERQLKILQASEVMNVEATYHRAMIHG